MLHELCMVGYTCLHVMMAAVACAAYSTRAREWGDGLCERGSQVRG